MAREEVGNGLGPGTEMRPGPRPRSELGPASGMVPLLAVVIGRNAVLPVLDKGKELLFARGELVVSAVSLGLGGYLGWQGVSGLMLH